MREPGSNAAQHAQYLVHTDELTGLYNRRFYNQTYPEITQKAQDESGSVAIIVIDVDFFKSINDRYGHQQGDAILQGVGAVINETVGMLGYPIRYAGDEFSILLPGVTRAQAGEVAAALCENMRQTPFTIASTGQNTKITLSVGVAHFPDDTDEAEKIFHCADHAAYLAKKRGRDGFVQYDAGSENVLDASTLSSYFPCQRLIARDAMLTPLIEGLLAPADHAVPWAVIAGPHGSGKTRLLQALRERADTQRRVLLEAASLPYRTGQPYGFILEAVGGYLHSHPQAGQQAAAILTATEIKTAARLLPDLSRYVLLPSSADRGDTTGHDVPDALCSLLLALGKGRSPSFLFDDFHRADQGTLQVMERLRQRDPRTFVCLGLRDDPDLLEHNLLLVDFVNGLLERGDAHLVQLDPLTEAEVHEMVTAILPGAERTPHLLELVWSRTAGVPLMVEEVLKFLVLQGCLRYEGKSLVVSGLDQAQVPADADDLMAQRAEQVEEDIRETMSRAAVVGREFDLDSLLLLEPRGAAYVQGILKRARKLHIAAEMQDGDGTLFHFISPQTHLAFYQAVPAESRQALHGQLARLREERAAASLVHTLNELAFHFSRAGDDERSAHYRRLIGTLFSSFTAADELEDPADLKDLLTGETADEEMLTLAARAASACRTCRNGLRMYGFEHVQRRGTFQEAAQALWGLLERTDAVTFSEADGRLLVNGTPLPQALQYGTSFLEFDAYAVQGLTFKRGLTLPELRAFLETLGEKPDALRARGGIGRVLAEAEVRSIIPSETIYVAVSERDILLKKASGSGRDMVIKQVEATSDAFRTQEMTVASAPAAATADADWVRERARWQREMAKYADPKMLDALARDWRVARQDLESGDAIRITAASKLYLEAGRKSVGPLLDVVSSTDDVRTRQIAVSLLTRVTSDAIERVRAMLGVAVDSEEKVRLLATLADFKDASLAAHVESFVLDEESSVRREAIRTLAACSPATLNHQLLRALKDPRDDVRVDVITAIGDHGVYEAETFMVDLIRQTPVFAAETSDRVQVAACQALGRLEAHKAVPALLGALARGGVSARTKAAAIRAAAALALERLAHEKNRTTVLAGLEQAAKDEDRLVRTTAMGVLNRIE